MTSNTHQAQLASILSCNSDEVEPFFTVNDWIKSLMDEMLDTEKRNFGLFQESLSEIIQAFLQHFRLEQRIMGNLRLQPKDHLLAHRNFLKVLVQINTSIAAGEVIAAHRICGYIERWSHKHYFEFDFALEHAIEREKAYSSGFVFPSIDRVPSLIVLAE